MALPNSQGEGNEEDKPMEGIDPETLARTEKERKIFMRRKRRKESLAEFFRRLMFWRRESEEESETEFIEEEVHERAREIARALLTKRDPP